MDMSETGQLERERYVNSRQQKRKEEAFFKKEFAKDVKRMQEGEKEQKPDLIDQYVDGEIDLPSFLEQMSRKNTKNVRQQGQKRLPFNSGSAQLNKTSVVSSKKTIFDYKPG